MNSVLEHILHTGQVSDGTSDFPLAANMDAEEGKLLSRVIEHVKPETSLEIGFAYGISTLFICDALSKSRKPVRHIVIDPYQFSDWKGIGMANVTRAGYDSLVHLCEEPSEIALPKLLKERTVVDMAVIDGWHTFDHALVDFFYVNKMLRVGGVVVLDDSSMPAVGKLVQHILTYGCYKVFGVPGGPALSIRKLAYYAGLKKSMWPSAVALEKTAADDRAWNWHKHF